MTEPNAHGSSPTPGDNRRDFAKKVYVLGALGCGAAVTTIPLLPGLAILTDPLRGDKVSKIDNKPPFDDPDPSPGTWVKVAALDALNVEQAPQRFTLITDREDAWTVLRRQPVGGVFLQKVNGKLKAITTVCPHLGCSVGFDGGHNNGQGAYTCPCHESVFNVGSGKCEQGPSARPLDELPLREHDGYVWVKFQKFQSTTADKIVQG